MYRLYKGSQGYEREVKLKWQAGQRKMCKSKSKVDARRQELDNLPVVTNVILRKYL